MPEGTPRGDFETGLTTDDQLDLRTWLRLLTCANMIEGEVRAKLRTAFDITIARFDLLAQLDRADPTDRGLTMGELSRRLMVTNGNVTALIDRLVGEKLVVRRADPDDRRAQIIELTPNGRRAFAKMSQAHASWITGLFDGVDRKNLEALYRNLAELKTSLKADSDMEGH
ncbi:MAG: MarR family transcriptional regulator [Rhodospirillaceae bacterium]|jgi:DNA-binding MarR family transcriptional regulator|nr:MarR family transcriptional regulator [Rhodospirillaceae bacterium]MBT3811138.1 MarR family transcriptional regulator [Rhodospirillaceae bacterium]MBT3931315.1 MarR family transcriptional regulator [Rhodospirillaceae bacterium]MBT4772204.1 MarR family transcriptional regulator [Rhodospirillaceae bacterium]MBT5359491.1 MarR family transcriptional regulator [Rhodospirillaceae bacterium]